MKNEIYELKNRLTETDLKVLHNIYLFRCLTIRQVYNMFFIKEMQSFNKFLDEKINKWISLGVIEEVVFNDNIALFLTKLGIDVIRDVFDLPMNIVDPQNKVIKRGYYRASELKMLPRLIPHQVYLNQFVLDFKTLYEHKNLTPVWKYFDEKYVSQYTSIRPDGLIRLLDIDFFLEMDMNTESKAQLIDKWKHYRTFLSSREYKFTERKIVVLFIIDNTSNIENRKNLIKLTVSETILDLFDGNFEIIVGTKEELMKKLFLNIIPEAQGISSKKANLVQSLNKHKFNVSDGSKLKDKLNNFEYEFYIRKNSNKDSIAIEGNRIQEYLLDYYLGDNLSTISNMSFLSANSSMFKYYFKRDICYIVVCDNLEKMYKELSLYKLENNKNIYFTTINRLQNKPLYSALCQFDDLGRMFSFKDNQLLLRVYET